MGPEVGLQASAGRETLEGFQSPDLDCIVFSGPFWWVTALA